MEVPTASKRAAQSGSDLEDRNGKARTLCKPDSVIPAVENGIEPPPDDFLVEWKPLPTKQNAFINTDPEKMSTVESYLRSMPPLVQPGEVKKLRRLLLDVYERRRFILQAGDCAERFLDCDSRLIELKLRILLQMSMVLSWAGRLPIVKIGRIAGQYAKPRSADYETVDGDQVMTFRGDSVNGFNSDSRTPDPERLVKAYFHSTATLNYIRSLLSTGFADLKEADHWKLEYVNSRKRREEYDQMVQQMLNALHFMDVCGVQFGEGRRGVDFFTSHEALVLPYEAGLSRLVDGKYYNLSAHFVWIGDRTRQLDHAHVGFCRKLENPIGLKLGPSVKPEEVVELCKALNAENVPGKLVLITRMGAELVGTRLPPLIRAVSDAGMKVVWQCDPMHGNTETTPSKIKTRQFDRILQELLETYDIHQACGSFLGGVHLELTGEDVTECVGGPQEISEEDLALRYATYCDPRLNYAQSMEIAFQLAKRIRVNVKEDQEE